MIVAAIAAGALVSCAEHATRPEVASLAGQWGGPDSNRLGLATLVVTLTQTGASVTGTAALRPIDPDDGSCGSCHRFKDGTLAGEFDGKKLTFSMTFPTGNEGDPTPECSVAVFGSVTERADGSLAGTYFGSDPCEGTFDGAITLSRQFARVAAPLRRLRATRPSRGH